MSKLAPFISFDGIDGTGKSTQCRLLLEWLASQQISAIRCADPGGTPVGDRIRELLLDRNSSIGLRTEALLFMASRAELVDRVIRPALESQTVVISDRFVTANVVYQGYAGGLSPEDLRLIGRFSSAELIPDLTIIFDLPVKLAASRRQGIADRLEARGEAYFERVREGFLREVLSDPERFRVIDASASISEIQSTLRALLTPVLQSHGLNISSST